MARIVSNVLIPDYLGKQVTAGARALTRSGSNCHIATWSAPFLGRLGTTRAIREILPLVSSSSHPEDYVDQVMTLQEEYHYDAVIPFGLTSYYALSRNRERGKSVLPCLIPDEDKFDTANDKSRITDFCKGIGIPSPGRVESYDLNDLGAIARHFRYPIVLKAKSGSGVVNGLRYVTKPDQFMRAYEEITKQKTSNGAFNYAQPIIQEFIPGFVHDACSLTDRGRVINILTQMRQLMYPIHGGVGAVNVTTDDQGVRSMARKLLEELEWTGPAQIEFKFDERDHQYKIIEFNPKFWGTLQLSIVAGMDFPSMLRDHLMGQAVKTDQSYAVGVRCKFIFPQAAYAYYQVYKEFGLRYLFDKQHYSRTYTDIDLCDPGPDIEAIFSFLYDSFKRGPFSGNDNLPPDLVPLPTRS
jgi:predicted ATP-grasp superfamily ATP-dependent carboligase